MIEHGSDVWIDWPIDGNEANRHQMWSNFKNLLEGPRVPVICRTLGELKNCFSPIGNIQIIHSLSDVESAVLPLMCLPGHSLSFAPSERTWINVGLPREAIDKRICRWWERNRGHEGHRTLTQAGDETPDVLGTSTMKLSDLVFSDAVQEKAAIQAQFVDFFIDALEKECIKQGVIKKFPIRLSVAIDLAKFSEKVWKNTRSNEAKAQVWKWLVIRKRERNIRCEIRTQKGRKSSQKIGRQYPILIEGHGSWKG